MQGLTLGGMERNFPYPRPRAVQVDALRKIVEADRGLIFEICTGEGKTGIGIAALAAMAAREGPVFYVTPNKVQTGQVMEVAGKRLSLPLLGRVEHPCLYYEDRGIPNITAQESPCYPLQCGHRVDQETGETEEPGAAPCPYFQAKYEARIRSEEGGIVVCTAAGFLTNRILDPRWAEMKPQLVVFDEIHRLASAVRAVFENTITDYHLARLVEILRDALGDRKAAGSIRKFRATFMRIARKRKPRRYNLLDEKEIEELLAIIDELDEKELLEKVKSAVAAGKIDPLAQKSELKLLVDLSRSIPRFKHSLTYAIADEEAERGPLNYLVAFYYRKDDPEVTEGRRRARYILTIKAYFVAGLIRKAVGKAGVIGMSATIGDPKYIGYETRLRHPFHSFPPSFTITRTGIYLPTDVPDLAMRVRRRQDLNRTLRRIVRAAKDFARRGHRSLVVVVSNEERRKFHRFADEEGLSAVSYGDNGVTARQAAERFKEGEGEALVGTVAQYGEGVDLPGGTAPIIFFLRPGYPRLDDPQSQFEMRKFGERHCWALWQWRVAIEALQVRGRNIRTARDFGVCFFMSQHFRKFLYGSLPEWLRPAYKGNLAMEAAVADALKVLAQ